MLKKISELCKQHKVTILSGLATTAIWELGKTILKGLPDAGYKLMRYLGNIPYLMAPLPIEDMLFMLVIGCIICFAITTGLSVLIRAIDELIQAKTNKRFNERKRSLVKKKISSAQSTTENLETHKYSASHKLINNVVRAFVFFIIALFFSLAMFKPQSLRLTFETNVEIISPYTDEDTIKKLKSDWAQMKTKEDYLAIDKAISEIIDSNNLRKLK